MVRSWLAAFGPSGLATLLLGSLPLYAAPTALVPAVKWHPGHYIYVDDAELSGEMMTLPHFRGVQKAYSWREFEPEKDRYDFSPLRKDLAFVKQFGRQLVVQFTFKSFRRGERNVPDYLQGPEFGGGVYRTKIGALNPVIWSRRVGERMDLLLAAMGREFDRDPNLEAVNLPETAPSIAREAQPGVDAYSDEVYFEALKRDMLALRRAFPNTVVIQYTNFPPSLLPQLTDYEKEIGMGMGGPDVYPREDAVADPEKGVYRLYAKLAGTVPMGAAVQRSNYSVADKKRNAIARGQKTMNGAPVIITAQDENFIPVREHLRLAQQTLKLNYMFWAPAPKAGFEGVKKLLAGAELADDPAGGLETNLPSKAFFRP